MYNLSNYIILLTLSSLVVHILHQKIKSIMGRENTSMTCFLIFFPIFKALSEFIDVCIADHLYICQTGVQVTTVF